MTQSTAKYKNVILYLAKALGGSIKGKKKLAKLLYYVDFDRFEYKESMKSVTGDTYKAWKMGPVPIAYAGVIDELIKDNKLDHTREDRSTGYNPTDVYLAKAEPDMSLFDEDDINILDHVAKKYGGLNGTQLQHLTHDEAPYIGTEPDSKIDYELAFYRETDFSDVLADT